MVCIVADTPFSSDESRCCQRIPDRFLLCWNLQCVEPWVKAIDLGRPGKSGVEKLTCVGWIIFAARKIDRSGPVAVLVHTVGSAHTHACLEGSALFFS